MKRFGLFGWLTALLASALLTGCFEEEKVSLSYLGVNHTDKEVVELAINGEGEIGRASCRERVSSPV